MTYETLVFIRSLLERMSIPVKDPNFRQLTMQMVKALDELDEAMNQVQQMSPNGSITIGKEV